MANHRNPKREVRYFNGRRYTRLPHGKSKSHARYFYCNEWDKKRKRYVQHALHRDMWIAAYGPISPGHDIHHIDEDWDNNVLSNFECITKSGHHRHHGADPKLKRIMRRWHRKNNARLQAASQAVTGQLKHYTCQTCGKSFTSKSYKAKHCQRIECKRVRWRAADARARERLASQCVQ